MTRLELFVNRWGRRGCGSVLCPGPPGGSSATVVLGKGAVPCDVLFVGEAPGTSEDALGEPFVGPAGKVLDRIVTRAVIEAGLIMRVRFAYTNLVCCIPREPGGNGKLEEPPDAAVKQCSGRLVEFVGLCAPKAVVSVGKLAKEWLDQTLKVKVPLPQGVLQAHLVHPSAILQANPASRAHLELRNVVTLRNLLTDLAKEQ